MNEQAENTTQDRTVLMHLDPKLLYPTLENQRVIDTAAESFKDLVDSIKAKGVLIPLHARPHPTRPGKYDLRAGHRRFAAAGKAKLKTVPVIVHLDQDDTDALLLTAVENMNREDLTPHEEAATVIQLMDRLGDAKAVAKALNRGERWVLARARLTSLIEPWRQAWQRERTTSGVPVWTTRHMEIIARQTPEGQQAIFDEFVEEEYLDEPVYESPSTRDLQDWINRELLHRLKSAPWPLADATLFGGSPGRALPACDGCPMRTSTQGALFADLEDDRCVDAGCWKAKQDAWLMSSWHKLSKAPDATVLISDAWPLSKETQDLLAKMYKAQPLCKGKYTTCKPKTKGAVPAFIADGPEAGKIINVQIDKGTRARGHTNSDPSAQGNPTPLAERRAALASKRNAHLLKALREKVRGMDVSDLPEGLYSLRGVLLLAGAFGTNHKNGRYGHAHTWNMGRGSRTIDPWAWLDERLPRDGEIPPTPSVLSEVWRSVRPVLAARLTYAGGVTQVPKGLPEEAAIMASRLGIDLEPLIQDAVAALPEPKSWSKLEAEEAAAKKAEKAKTKAKKPKVKAKAAPAPEPGPGAGIEALIEEANQSDVCGFGFLRDGQIIYKVDISQENKWRTFAQRINGEGGPPADMPPILAEPRNRRAEAEALLTGYALRLTDWTPCCRVCGCTEEDCSGCIEKTGNPCSWEQPGLCSACGDHIRANMEAT